MPRSHHHNARGGAVLSAVYRSLIELIQVLFTCVYVRSPVLSMDLGHLLTRANSRLSGNMYNGMSVVQSCKLNMFLRSTER